MLFWLRIVIHILKVMLAELEYDSVYKNVMPFLFCFLLPCAGNILVPVCYLSVCGTLVNF